MCLCSGASSSPHGTVAKIFMLCDEAGTVFGILQTLYDFSVSFYLTGRGGGQPRQRAGRDRRDDRAWETHDLVTQGSGRFPAKPCMWAGPSSATKEQYPWQTQGSSASLPSLSPTLCSLRALGPGLPPMSPSGLLGSSKALYASEQPRGLRR